MGSVPSRSTRSLERIRTMAAKSPKEHYLDTLYKDLALALGDAVWAFAKIEWLTYERLRRLSGVRLDEWVGGINFRPRTAILRSIIEGRDAPTQAKKRALAAIKAAEDLAEQRNIIVHNPWSIWVDLDAGEFMTEIQRYAGRGKSIDLKQLSSFTDSCLKVETEMREALNAL